MATTVGGDVADTDANEKRTICLACGETLDGALDALASLRCHDCRATDRPLRPDLVTMPQQAGARL
jgi:hypothetical protein